MASDDQILIHCDPTGDQRRRDLSFEELESMRTISDVVRVERSEETILQRDHDTGELITAPAPRQKDQNVVSLDGKRTSPRVNFRPDKPPPVDTIVNVYDNGRLPPVANENKPLPYPLKGMADRQELGGNESENRKNWANAELFRIHLAIAQGEPLYDPFADDPTVTHPTERYIHAREVAALAEDFLGDGFRVLKRVMIDCWSAQMLGFDQGRKDRGQASADGQATILAALRQLTRFYDKLDRIERSGESPREVWPMVGTFTPSRPSLPCPQRGKSYLNQARGPVRLSEPWVSTPPTI
ncbi:hypothetical protein ACVWZZ_006113 [Bradyrhizobium sp. LM6.10]